MAHVFFSYSHADEALRNELEKHLAGLCREGVITTWHDRRIGPGDDLHGQIHDQLDSADIVLLLVSSDFLDSDYCYDVEMTVRAMQRHERGEARVIPIGILRPCDWHGTPFRGPQCCAPRRQTRHQARHARTTGSSKLQRQSAKWRVRRTPGSRASRQAHAAIGHAHPASPGPDRSSNLRVPSEFTDRDRHAFLTKSFEYIARYFENSLAELQARNDRVETNFRQIDANRFEARAFVAGEERALCGIWLGGRFGTNELYFSFEGVGDASGYNESMSVSDDGYTLLLEPLGMAHFGQHDRSALTMEGAAEYFWNLFVERLR